MSFLNLSKTALSWWFKSGWVAIGLATLVGAQYVDTKIFPVISGFRATVVLAVPRGVEISGELFKPLHREGCEFIDVVADVDGVHSVPIVFLDRAPGAPTYTRTAGWSHFGPWLIAAPGAKNIRLISRHRCHVLWSHKTALAEIIVRELP